MWTHIHIVSSFKKTYIHSSKSHILTIRLESYALFMGGDFKVKGKFFCLTDCLTV